MTVIAPLESDPVYGAAVANYPSDRRRLILIGGVIGFVSGFVLNWTTATIPGWVGPVSTILLMAGIGLGLAWYALHLWNREIVLYTRGFSTREGSNIVFFFYAEVRGARMRAEQLAYFGGLVRRPVYVTTITTVRDEVIKVDGVYKRASEFGGAFFKAAGEVLRAGIDAALAKGETVAFGGGLTAAASGLAYEGRQLAWAECGGYRAAQRKLNLLDAEGRVWAGVPLAAVENLPIVIELLRDRSAGAAQPTAQVNRQTDT